MAGAGVKGKIKQIVRTTAKRILAVALVLWFKTVFLLIDCENGKKQFAVVSLLTAISQLISRFLEYFNMFAW